MVNKNASKEIKGEFPDDTQTEGDPEVKPEIKLDYGDPLWKKENGGKMKQEGSSFQFAGKNSFASLADMGEEARMKFEEFTAAAKIHIKKNAKTEEEAEDTFESFMATILSSLNYLVEETKEVSRMVEGLHEEIDKDRNTAAHQETHTMLGGVVSDIMNLDARNLEFFNNSKRELENINIAANSVAMDVHNLDGKISQSEKKIIAKVEHVQSQLLEIKLKNAKMEEEVSVIRHDMAGIRNDLRSTISIVAIMNENFKIIYGGNKMENGNHNGNEGEHGGYREDSVPPRYRSASPQHFHASVSDFQKAEEFRQNTGTKLNFNNGNDTSHSSPNLGQQHMPLPGENKKKFPWANQCGVNMLGLPELGENPTNFGKLSGDNSETTKIYDVVSGLAHRIEYITMKEKDFNAYDGSPALLISCMQQWNLAIAQHARGLNVEIYCKNAVWLVVKRFTGTAKSWWDSVSRRTTQISWLDFLDTVYRRFKRGDVDKTKFFLYKNLSFNVDEFPAASMGDALYMWKNERDDVYTDEETAEKYISEEQMCWVAWNTLKGVVQASMKMSAKFYGEEADGCPFNTVESFAKALYAVFDKKEHEFNDPFKNDWAKHNGSKKSAHLDIISGERKISAYSKTPVVTKKEDEDKSKKKEDEHKHDKKEEGKNKKNESTKSEKHDGKTDTEKKSGHNSEPRKPNAGEISRNEASIRFILSALNRGTLYKKEWFECGYKWKEGHSGSHPTALCESFNPLIKENYASIERVAGKDWKKYLNEPNEQKIKEYAAIQETKSKFGAAKSAYVAELQPSGTDQSGFQKAP